MTKHASFIANSLDSAFKFQQLLARLDVEVTAGSTLQLRRLLAPGTDFDLVIFEATESGAGQLEEVFALAENRGCSLLVITDKSHVEDLRLPSRVISDFVMQGASPVECEARLKRLLYKGDMSDNAQEIVVDTMVVNLATYQVKVAGEPIDFTYLEYALLAFLVQHPNRTFSRDVLLSNVWGFDYYCGSRTVDVHVRRIRAKLGPALAQHIETVRGVGYHWKM